MAEAIEFVCQWREEANGGGGASGGGGDLRGGTGSQEKRVTNLKWNWPFNWGPKKPHPDGPILAHHSAETHGRSIPEEAAPGTDLAAQPTSPAHITT